MSRRSASQTRSDSAHSPEESIAVGKLALIERSASVVCVWVYLKLGRRERELVPELICLAQ